MASLVHMSTAHRVDVARSFHHRAKAFAPAQPVALALAARLLADDVVVGDVRSDGAAGRRVAHHHVVHAPARQEGEALAEALHLLERTVDALDEQRPVLVGVVVAERRKVAGTKWAAPALPRRAAAALADERRRGARLASEGAQALW